MSVLRNITRIAEMDSTGREHRNTMQDNGVYVRANTCLSVSSRQVSFRQQLTGQMHNILQHLGLDKLHKQAVDGEHMFQEKGAPDETKINVLLKFRFAVA